MKPRRLLGEGDRAVLLEDGDAAERLDALLVGVIAHLLGAHDAAAVARLDVSARDVGAELRVVDELVGLEIDASLLEGILGRRDVLSGGSCGAGERDDRRAKRRQRHAASARGRHGRSPRTILPP
jgi:hypothetical protein